MSISTDRTVSRSKRPAATVALVFLHLLVAPCAATPVVMTGDADCEHYRVVDSSAEYLCASALSRAVVESGLFDSNKADLRHPSGRPAMWVPAAATGLVEAPPDDRRRGRPGVARYTRAPPLYLLLGRLRI